MKEREREEWETSADKWDMSENASLFAWRFQVIDSLYISEYASWFNVWSFESIFFFLAILVPTLDN